MAALDTTGGTITPGTLNLAGTVGSWGAYNYGQQLLVTGPGTNPTTAIADSTGANWLAFTNSAGGLLISGMPATSDSTTPPVQLAGLSAGGQFSVGFNSQPGGTKLQIGPVTDSSSSPGYFVSVQKTFSGTGGTTGTAPATLRVQGNVTGASPNFSVYNVSSVMTLATTGLNSNTLPTGINSLVTRTSGATASWQYQGQTIDQTGLPPSASAQSVGMALQLQQNGPDGANVYFNPASGGRSILSLNAADYIPPSWAALTAYASGAVVTPGNGYVYIATTGGTSGSTAPTWPTSSGTVADGTVTWSFGTTQASVVSRALSIGGPTFGAAILANAAFTNAVLDFSHSTLATSVNANAAGIRLTSNMPIDFSADGTAAGQNVRVLRYNSSAAAFQYVKSGTVQFSISDTGSVTITGALVNQTFTGTTDLGSGSVTGAALASYLASPPNIGATAPATIACTSFTATCSMQTGTSYTIVPGDYSLIFNPTAAMTISLPAASAVPGRTLVMKTIAAFAVNSSFSNVVPLAGGANGVAILPAAVGKWCILQSNGVAWQIMAAN